MGLLLPLMSRLCSCLCVSSACAAPFVQTEPADISCLCICSACVGLVARTAHVNISSAERVSILLQRRSRRSLALRGASRGDLTGNNPAALSSRRLSLEKAQSRKAASSQKALDSRQALEGHGIADGHQKPSGTVVNPLADVETGQMHLDTAMETGDLATHSQATSNNAGGVSSNFLV